MIRFGNFICNTLCFIHWGGFISAVLGLLIGIMDASNGGSPSTTPDDTFYTIIGIMFGGGFIVAMVTLILLKIIGSCIPDRYVWKTIEEGYRKGERTMEDYPDWEKKWGTMASCCYNTTWDN